MKSKISLRYLIGILLAVATGTISSIAQADPLINVRIVTVKSGHVEEWVELQKELAEASKEAGARGRTVWEVVKGDHNTFHIISEYENWADFGTANELVMGESEWANWVNSIQKLIQARRELVLQSYPELTVPAKEGFKVKLARVKETILKAGLGQGSSYRAWLKATKSDAAPVSVSSIALGGNVRTFYTFRRFESWADMDKPPESSMSREVLREGRDLIQQTNFILLSYRPDLSY